MPVSGDHYWQDEDGLWVEKVCPWAKEKLEIVTDYIQISSATRRKYTHCAFIDVFSGPGRSQVRDTSEFIDGSPVAAFKQSLKSQPFSAFHISDADNDLSASAATRLRNVGCAVQVTKGPASAALTNIVRGLNQSGLHLALLDPHNLGTLSFDLFEALARLKRIDVIVHVSLSDLQRNADRYSSSAYAQFDRFAPGWREAVKIDMNQTSLRAAILEYWTEKLVGLGLPRAKHCELIKGKNSQRLYWLMFLARHPLPHAFWEKITSRAESPQLIFEGVMSLEIERTSAQGITVPYPPLFDDIRRNCGFIDTRRNPGLAANIAEGEASAALRDLLVDVASRDRYFSLGCDLGEHEKSNSPVSERFVAGGYIQLSGFRYEVQETHDYDKFCEELEIELGPLARGEHWRIQFQGTYVSFQLAGEERVTKPSMWIWFFAAGRTREKAVISREQFLKSLQFSLNRENVIVSALKDRAGFDASI